MFYKSLFSGKKLKAKKLLKTEEFLRILDLKEKFLFSIKISIRKSIII